MSGNTMKEDKLLTACAKFATGVSGELDAQSLQAAKLALMDALAVSLGALPHPAAQIARKYAGLFPTAGGATVWGSGDVVNVEAATLVNGVPLRGYDYNDFYFGKAAGHPSDIIPGLLALAEWRRYSGSEVLTALAIGYDVCISLFDTFDIDANGWDYPMLVSVAAVCAFARLIGLTKAQTREAIAIAVVSHFVSDESESHELNARGDLTMWEALQRQRRDPSRSVCMPAGRSWSRGGGATVRRAQRVVDKNQDTRGRAPAFVRAARSVEAAQACDGGSL